MIIHPWEAASKTVLVVCLSIFAQFIFFADSTLSSPQSDAEKPETFEEAFSGSPLPTPPSILGDIKNTVRQGAVAMGLASPTPTPRPLKLDIKFPQAVSTPSPDQRMIAEYLAQIKMREIVAEGQRKLAQEQKQRLESTTGNIPNSISNLDDEYQKSCEQLARLLKEKQNSQSQEIMHRRRIRDMEDAAIFAAEITAPSHSILDEPIHVPPHSSSLEFGGATVIQQTGRDSYYSSGPGPAPVIIPSPGRMTETFDSSGRGTLVQPAGGGYFMVSPIQ
jgi:hypothetical protein